MQAQSTTVGHAHAAGPLSSPMEGRSRKRRTPRRRLLRATGIVARLSLRLWQYVPVTVLGILVALLGYYLFDHYGRGQVDQVLHPAGVVAMGLVGLDIGMVLVASLVLYLRVRRSHWELPERLEADYELTTEAALPAFVAWPLIQIEWQWRYPENVDVTLRQEGRWLKETITPRERGEHKTIVRQFTVRDIFGLASFSFSHRFQHEYEIWPAVASLANADITMRFSGGEGFSHPAGKQEGELVEMRGYSYGDPLRYILWKTFARSRKLLVRMPERAIVPNPSAAAYLVAGPGDEPSAAAARAFVERGLLGKDFIFCADGSNHPTQDAPQALKQIVRSASHRAHGGVGLERFFSQAATAGSNNYVLFVPSTVGPWMDHLEGSAAMARKSTFVVLGVDGELPSATGGFLRRLLLMEQKRPLRSSQKLPELYDRLVRSGYQVNVLHRPSGRLLDQSQIRLLAGWSARSAG